MDSEWKTNLTKPYVQLRILRVDFEHLFLLYFDAVICFTFFLVEKNIGKLHWRYCWKNMQETHKYRF